MTPVTWIRTRLARCTDTEHEQVMLRVLIGIGMIAYLHYAASESPAEWLYASHAYLIVLMLCIAAAFVIFACILVWPQPSPARRVIANALDVAGITFPMIYGGEYAAPLFGVYLWITFGNGFRFGAPYLAS